MTGAALSPASRAIGPQAEVASRAFVLPGARRLPRETGPAPVTLRAEGRRMICPMRRKPVAALAASLAAHVGGLALAAAAFLADPAELTRGGEEAIAVELVSAGDLDIAGTTQSLPVPRAASEAVVPKQEPPVETPVEATAEPEPEPVSEPVSRPVEAAVETAASAEPVAAEPERIAPPLPPEPVAAAPVDVLAALPLPDLAISAPDIPVMPVPQPMPAPQPVAEAKPEPAKVETPKPTRVVRPVPARPPVNAPVTRESVDKIPAPRTPVAQAATPAPSSSRGGSGGATQSAGTGEIASYRARVLAHLARHKTYPTAARSAGVEGRTIVSFTLTREGGVTNVALAGASGSALLDEATLAMVRRAAPFPPMPFPPMPDGSPATLTIVTAIRFDLR